MTLAGVALGADYVDAAVAATWSGAVQLLRARLLATSRRRCCGRRSRLRSACRLQLGSKSSSFTISSAAAGLPKTMSYFP